MASENPFEVSSLNEAPPSQPRQGSCVNWGAMVTGVLMMVGAAVWFVVGLAGERMIVYPLILFGLGTISFFRGLFGSERQDGL